MDFERIAKVSRQRCERWHPNGLDDWSLEEWGNAFFGEAGELANVLKKIHRVQTHVHAIRDAGIEELRVQAGEELGDTYLYMDLACQAAGVEIKEIVVEHDAFYRESTSAQIGNRLGMVAGRFCECMAQGGLGVQKAMCDVYGVLQGIADHLSVDI